MMNPKKELGQHWLDDEASLQAVADIAEINDSDTVLEIGPGPGALTSVLVERAEHVIALEIDHELAQKLPNAVPAKNLTVIEGDIRHANFSDLPNGYKVAANIPYYLTSHIIQLLLAARPQPAVISLLIQKEVAERVAAEPGAMSILSVATQLQSDVTLGPVVLKELFHPVPKVDSQIIGLTPKSPPDQLEDILRIVKAGFGERRKKLANSLSGGLRIEKSEITKALNDVGIDESARAQDLSLDDWRRLANHALFAIT